MIHGFQSAYWVALGIAALGIIPCIVLARAERPKDALVPPPTAEVAGA